MNTKFKFLAGEIAPHTRCSGPHYLYNLYEYLEVWPNLKHQSFYMVNSKSNMVEGYIRFQIVEGIAYSLYKAPFGSFSISANIGFHTLTEFIGFIEDHLRLHGIREIVIRHYPNIYDPGSCELIAVSLRSMDFDIDFADINHFIEVTPLDFAAHMHKMEQRKLRKCQNAGFIFHHHANTEAGLVFRYIESFRQTRHIPVHIEWNTLLDLVHKFPDRYGFYSVSDGDEIIAATVCIDVNQSVLYNFLPASSEAYKTFSPMVYLLERIYNHAQQRGFRYIDLGISSIKGKPQNGLIKFKEHVGGKPMIKCTFKK